MISAKKEESRVFFPFQRGEAIGCKLCQEGEHLKFPLELPAENLNTGKVGLVGFSSVKRMKA